MPTVQLGKCSSCCGSDCPDYKKFRVMLSPSTSPGFEIQCYYQDGTIDRYSMAPFINDADIQDYLQNGGSLGAMSLQDYLVIAEAVWEPQSGSLGSGLDGNLTINLYRGGSVACTYKKTGCAYYYSATGGIIDAPPLS